MKSWKQTSCIFVIFVIILYFLSPLNYLTLSDTFADEKDKSSSTIGGVKVDGLNEDEIHKALEAAIQSWISKPLVITGGGAELSLDPSEIRFDINETIENYKRLTSKPWFAFWESEKNIQLPLQIVQNDKLKNDISSVAMWNTEQTYDKVLMQASYLRSQEVKAEILHTTMLESERLSLSIEEIPVDAQGIQNLIDRLNDYVLNPNKPFSLLNSLGEFTKSASDDALNFVASVLYNTVIQTSFNVIERHSQNKIPAYLEPGIEAEVNAFEKKDLQFVNNTSQPSIIKASIEGNSLKLEIYSSIKESDVSIQVVQDERIEPRIINRYTKNLPIGQQTLVQEGEEGLRVTVYRSIMKDRITDKQRISRDYYAPSNRIVLQSSRQPELITDGIKNNEPSTTDSIPNVDLDGDGLPDFEGTEETVETPTNEHSDIQSEVGKELPPDSYYDKGGNLVTP